MSTLLSIQRYLFVTIAVFCAVFAALQPAFAETDYVLRYEGVSGGLLDKLKLISELEKRNREYPTASALRRAARRDSEAFHNALRAAGHYAGKASFEVMVSEDGENREVVYLIERGPAFEITEYDILYQDEAEGRPASLQAAKIEPNRSAAGADIRNVQIQFLNRLWESGYPAAEIIGRRAIANLDKGTANAVLIFRSGPKADFGELRIDGAEKTKTDFLEKLKTWAPGDEYERSKMVQYRDRLAKTGLFTAVDVAPGAPDADGAAPIIVELSERKPRTVGAGASYSTSEGPGGRVFFEHRNILGRGERLHIELRGTKIDQSINFDADKPLPGLPGLTYGNFRFSNETTDAYKARSVSLGAGLAKNWLDDRLVTRGGLGLETSNVRSNGDEERTYLVSAPLSVTWNSENDLLNPTKGVQARWSVTPYTGTDNFTQTRLTARSRLVVGENNFFTLAGRAELGATFGSSLANLPLNKRYYAGGAGSVRGFSFQEAGPLDEDNDPIGGRSLIEGGVEARFKVTDKIQIAGFADAGSVSPKATPDFSEAFFIGVGGGVRYFTAIGPIRADIAFPLDKRESDRGFQILISIGQPF